MKKKVSYNDFIRTSYPLEKKMVEKRNNPASYLVYRPISFPVSWACYMIGLRPNHVTFLALFSSLYGLFMLLQSYFLIGALFLNLAYLLDQVDGSLARSMKLNSEAGSWLDSLVGYTYSGFYLLSISIGYFTSQNGTIDVVSSFLQQSDILVIGTVGSFAILVRKWMVNTSSSICARPVSTQIANSSHFYYAIPKYINSFSMLLLLISVLSQVISLFILALSVFHVIQTILVAMLVWRGFDN
jgi:phosphatidylglycerophosphate synthase